MIPSESSGMVPTEFCPQSFRLASKSHDDDVLRSEMQGKRKLGNELSPRLLKYRKISSGFLRPVSFVTEDMKVCDSVRSVDIETPEKVVNYYCNDDGIRKYLKITKRRSGYKLFSADARVENAQDAKQPPLEKVPKITDYFKSCFSSKTPEKSSPHPAIQNPVDDAIVKSTEDHCLIGNFSRPHSLPTVQGKHADLPSISPETMVKVLKGEYDGSFVVLDCRYPYEYEGGHIIRAKNFYTKSAMAQKLFSYIRNLKDSLRPILIFHCEFSSERGPNMFRFVRNKDRELNSQSYPSLYYPEMYILEGGYSAFYAKYKSYCDPESYKKMRDENHTQDMVNCRAKTKADNGNSCRKSFRDRLKPRILF